MKTLSKLVTVLAVAIVAIFPARADQYVNADMLPDNAKTFIQKNYASEGYRTCERDDDGHYDVELRNGVDLEFDADGKLLKIDGGTRRVSKSVLKQILPAKAYAELESRNVLGKVDEVEFNRYNIKIDLRVMRNDEIVFDIDGNLQYITD